MAQDFPPNQPPVQPEGTRSPNPAWIVGLILVLVGVIFLLQNLNLLGPIPFLQNWWALFILIPAAGAFYRVGQDIQTNGRLTSAGRGSLVGGLLLGFVTCAFLFGLDWGIIWPVFLIIAGIGALLGMIFR